MKSGAEDQSGSRSCHSYSERCYTEVTSKYEIQDRTEIRADVITWIHHQTSGAVFRRNYYVPD